MNFKELAGFVNNIEKTYHVPCYDICIYHRGARVFRKKKNSHDFPRTFKGLRKNLYFMHSGAKLMCCVALMQLVENKKLSLKDPICTFIENFNSEATIKDMIFEYSRTLDYERDDFGFENVSRIIEKASGISFNDYMEKNILNPLKMKSTSFVLSEKNKKKIAVQYVFNSKTSEITESNNSIYELYNKNKGCLITTVDDYALFCETLAGGKKHKLLSKENTLLLIDKLIYKETKKDGAFVCMGYNGGLVLVDVKKQITIVYGQHLQNIPVSQLEMYPTLRKLAYEAVGTDTWTKDYKTA